jgi:hypothetical protein
MEEARIWGREAAYIPYGLERARRETWRLEAGRSVCEGGF